MDLLSIAQMPKGVPVATMAVDNATNAGLMAIRILALSDKKLSQKLKNFISKQEKKIQQTNRRVQKLY